MNKYESDFITDYYNSIEQRGENLNSDKYDVFVDDTVHSSYPDRFDSLKDFNDNFKAHNELNKSVLDVINKNNSTKRIPDPYKLKGLDERINFEKTVLGANQAYYLEKNKYRLFDKKPFDELKAIEEKLEREN